MSKKNLNCSKIKQPFSYIKKVLGEILERNGGHIPTADEVAVVLTPFQALRIEEV